MGAKSLRSDGRSPASEREKTLCTEKGRCLSEMDKTRDRRDASDGDEEEREARKKFGMMGPGGRPLGVQHSLAFPCRGPHEQQSSSDSLPKPCTLRPRLIKLR